MIMITKLSALRDWVAATEAGGDSAADELYADDPEPGRAAAQDEGGRGHLQAALQPHQQPSPAHHPRQARERDHGAQIGASI